MATHSNILAGKFTRTEEPGGLQSMGLQRVWHDWTSPLYIYTHTHTYHIFIHSSVDRHLGASLSWVIEKNAAMNTEVYVSFWISVFIFLDTHPRVELLDHMAVLFSVFWETSILFSIVCLCFLLGGIKLASYTIFSTHCGGVVISPLDTCIFIIKCLLSDRCCFQW